MKLEQFVFDAIPLAKNAIVYETDRAEEFSPVKNAEGVDSPATCRRDQIRRAARWLREAGVEVPTGTRGRARRGAGDLAAVRDLGGAIEGAKASREGGGGGSAVF